MRSLWLKMKLKYWLLVGNIETLKIEFFNNPDAILKLSDCELRIIVNYALSNKEIILLNILMDYVNKYSRIRIIKCLLSCDCEVALCSLEKYFDDYVEVGLKTKNRALLYELIKLNFYSEKQDDKNRLTILDYFYNTRVDEYTVQVASLSPSFIDRLGIKILHSNSNWISAFLLLISIEEATKMIKNLVMSKDLVKIKEVFIQIVESESIKEVFLDEFFNIQEVSIRCNLLLLALNYISNINREKIINNIIAADSLELNLKLVRLLSEEEQEKYSLIALEKQNINLAIASISFANNIYVPSMIDFVFNNLNDSRLIMCIACMEENNLDYALLKIIILKGKNFYVEMIEKLRNIASINYYRAIDFLRNNTFFNEVELQEIEELRDNKELRSVRNIVYRG